MTLSYSPLLISIYKILQTIMLHMCLHINEKSTRVLKICPTAEALAQQPISINNNPLAYVKDFTYWRALVN